MNERKFFLKDFFKNYNSKEKSIEILWNNTEKKVKQHKEEIKENIKKIGELDNLIWNPQNLKDIYSKYQVYWKKHKTVKKMSNKELRGLLLILFPNSNEGVEKGLYESPDQFDGFLDTLTQKNKQLHLKKLISELLYHYPENENILFNRLNKIYQNLNRKKPSHKPLFEANKRFHLLEKSGPHTIAKNILDIQNDLNTLLSELWIKERHLHNGIGDKIVKELCEMIQWPLKRLEEGSFHQTDERILERFLEYLSGDKNIGNETIASPSWSLRGGKSKTFIVKTLLNPFEHKEPEKSVKTTIIQFLDQHIGDPRFFSEQWIAMPKEKNIFLRWKTGETIKDFLELLTYTAKKDSNADRMWPYRKEFIKFYWEADYITGAWIILGREAYKDRSKFLKEKSDNYGKIIRGANSLHSALIYTIGALTVSEWNYNGKVRIWNEDNKDTPVSYKKEYSRRDLTKNPNEEITHSNAKGYYWQKKLSDYIYEYTGIPCPEGLRNKIDRF